jgi:DNA mismatch repair ATPase MutS
LVVGRGGPRDLAAIRDGIAAAAGLAGALETRGNLPTEIAQAVAALRRPDAMIATELAAGLADELPHLKRDGGFVRAGYDAALDEARALRDDTRRVIAALQGRYAEDTGVRSLKISQRRSTRPSSTARRWPVRSASPPPNWAASKPRSPMPPIARSASRSKPSSGFRPW